MKTLKLTRREFTRTAGYAFVSAVGLTSLSTLSCSDDENGTNPSPPSDEFTVELSAHPELGQVGGVKAFSYEGTPIYVFRVGESSFRALSRVCTHQGCTVDWVSSNSQLNCPCHGSKFDQNGAVLTGPASQALQEFTTSYDAANNRLTIS